LQRFLHGYNRAMKTKLTLLGGLSTEEFLRDYWQKKEQRRSGGRKKRWLLG